MVERSEHHRRIETLKHRILKDIDTIPHDKLMAAVAFRIADGQVLRLIRMWLRAEVVETDQQGKRRIHRPKRGTPQGGVNAPLLANLYLHWFDKRFHAPDGPAQFAKAKLIRYADDFLVLARYQGRRLVEHVETLLQVGISPMRVPGDELARTQASEWGNTWTDVASGVIDLPRGAVSISISEIWE